MEFKGYGAGVEIYLADDGSYIDEHGSPVDKEQLQYGLDVKEGKSAWGNIYVYSPAGYDSPQIAPEKLVKQAISETEYESIACPYCGEQEIRPKGVQMITCASCGGTW